jgi:hypothetical protein
MLSNKEQIVEDIRNCRTASLAERAIVRKLFLLDPAYIFKNDRIIGFKILNSIAEKYRIPLGCVKIAGSSQTGFSSIKDRDFIFGESDLDIAIVSPELFQQYCETAFTVTNGYLNRTGFKDVSTADHFQSNLQIGFFRPELMPLCREKTEWLAFFKSITDRNSTIFRTINGAIYFSETFFEGKQIAEIKRLNPG